MSSKIVINKRIKGLPRNELEKLTHAELIDKIIQLEAYNFQLKNILHKKLTESDKHDNELLQELNNLQTQQATSIENKESEVPNKEPGKNDASNKQQKQRPFDFNKSPKRHVLLKFLYFGWDYQGFATQEESNATIEYHMFRALTRCCLIESRATSNYHRCGRTDKEVSAFCQVISIDIRSKFPAEQQFDEKCLQDEIDYCGVLNRLLPSNIQCITWMPVKTSLYSARFDCIARTYRYYFPKGDLNIEAMQKACLLLQRHTDFRNFCKMDVHNGVTNYTRNMHSAGIQLCPNEMEKDDRGYSMYYLEIKANAFIWHQIRCIMAILLLIGQENEQPDVITELLDVQKNPCKPQYTPAVGLPLNLFCCEFRSKTRRKSNDDTLAEDEDDMKVTSEDLTTSEQPDTTNWIYNEENLQKLIEKLQSEWTQFSIKSTMIRNVLYNLENVYLNEFKSPLVKSQALVLQDFAKPKQYQKLLNRKRCASLENRIEHFVRKQRLIVKPETSTPSNPQ